MAHVLGGKPRVDEGVGPFALAEPVLDVMCLESEPDAASECCGGAVAGIHLRGDAVEFVMVKPEGEYCSDGFAGETLPTVCRVEDPPDLALTVLVIGEPQGDVSDRDAAMLDDQRKRTSLAIEAGLGQALGELVAGDFRGPGIVQKVAGNVRSRVEIVKPFGIACLIQAEPEPLRHQRKLGGGAEIAPEMEQLLVLS